MDSKLSRDEWNSCLNNNYSLLIDNLALDDGLLLNDLLVQNVLNWVQVEQLKSKPNRRAKADSLMGMLRCIDTALYYIFFEQLMKFQPGLAIEMGVKVYFPSLYQNSSKAAVNLDMTGLTGDATCSYQGPSQSISVSLQTDNIQEMIGKSTDSKEVIHHLSNPDLNHCDEFATIKTVMKWIIHQKLQNVKEIRQLLNMLYFEWLSFREMHDILQFYSAISHNEYVVLEDVISTIKEWTTKWGKLSGQWGKPLDISKTIRPRPGLPHLLFAGGTRGFFGQVPSNAVDIFRATGDCVSCNAIGKMDLELPVPKVHAGIASDLSGNVFIIGGYDGKAKTNSAHVFGPITECIGWKELTPMYTARCDHAVCVANNKIYVIGGKDNDDELLASVEIYDIVKDKWVKGVAYPFPVYDTSITEYKGTCITAGGVMTGEIPVSSIYLYKIETQQWQLLVCMSQPKSAHAMATVNNKIYLIGGKGNPNTEVLDPESEQISVDLQIPDCNISSSAVVYNDCIITSHPNFGYCSQVYVFNTVSQSWNNFKVYLPCNKYKFYLPCPKTHLGLTYL